MWIQYSTTATSLHPCVWTEGYLASKTSAREDRTQCIVCSWHAYIHPKPNTGAIALNLQLMLLLFGTLSIVSNALCTTSQPAPSPAQRCPPLARAVPHPPRRVCPPCLLTRVCPHVLSKPEPETRTRPIDRGPSLASTLDDRPRELSETPQGSSPPRGLDS